MYFQIIMLWNGGYLFSSLIETFHLTEDFPIRKKFGGPKKINYCCCFLISKCIPISFNDGRN